MATILRRFAEAGFAVCMMIVPKSVLAAASLFEGGTISAQAIIC
jgi:hypothetical protein